MVMVCVLTFLTAFLLSLGGTWLMRRIAPRAGLVDHPSVRKIHTTPQPLGGGIAIWAAFSLTLGLAFLTAALARSGVAAIDRLLPASVLSHLPGMFSRASVVGMLLVLSTIVMLMGLVDDWRGLSYVLRLVIEMGLVGVLVWQDIRFTLFPPLSNFWVSACITIAWVVGLTNAFNFLDNMDGLSGGVAWISAGLFCILMLLLGDYFVAGFLLALLGSLTGFLWFNWPPARIFMGDAGSNFVGFLLGVVTILGTFTTPNLPHVTIVAPLCVMAVPLYDSITVILIRLRRGRSPFLPDKNHFSHRLVALGMTPKQAVLTIYLVTLATGLEAVQLYPLGDVLPEWRELAPSLSAVVILFQVTCLLGVVAVLEAAGRKGANGNGPDETPHPS